MAIIPLPKGTVIPNIFYIDKPSAKVYPLGESGDADTVPKVDATGDVEAGAGMKDPGANSDSIQFTDKSIRRAFIRKVYSILFVQLLVTLGFILLFLFHPDLKYWSRENRGLLVGAMVLTLGIMLAMAFSEKVRRKSPLNFICLGVFTLSEGFVLGTAASRYNQDTILLAVGITAVVCAALTLFSFQTKWDFTSHSGILFVATMLLIIFGVVMVSFRHKFPVLHVIYCFIGVLVFSGHMVYETQLMMGGGGHKCSISPEEYVYAALNIYIDMINIFFYVFTILNTFITHK